MARWAYLLVVHSDSELHYRFECGGLLLGFDHRKISLSCFSLLHLIYLPSADPDVYTILHITKARQTELQRTVCSTGPPSHLLIGISEFAVRQVLLVKDEVVNPVSLSYAWSTSVKSRMAGEKRIYRVLIL